MIRTQADIWGYFRAVTQKSSEEVRVEPEGKVKNHDPDSWVNALVDKYGMEQIAIDSSRDAFLED